jgi:UDP-N-acetylmuramate: L-alanyl-gamma-D-glutamyl-meso-diaminopimelate ligase
VTVIDDFAHHPTAVAGAIAAVRLRYPRRRLWAVFEPRSNTSRRKVFQREYVAALEAADQVVIGGVFQKATDAVSAAELFSPDQLAADLAARGVAAHAGGDADAIRTLLLNDVRRDDVILLMSNGDFGGLRRTLVDGLVARA